MRNRAKCKLCQSIIESFLPDEIVYCKCGEIAVCDGAAMRCVFNDVSNFLRVDEIGNEIQVRYKKEQEEGAENEREKNPDKGLSKSELIKSLEDTLEYTENAPDHEKYSFATNIALCHYIRALVNILKRE